MKMCKICSNEIDEIRLEILPDTTTCIDCMKKNEYKQKEIVEYAPIPIPTTIPKHIKVNVVYMNKSNATEYNYNISTFCEKYNIPEQDVIEAVYKNIGYLVHGNKMFKRNLNTNDMELVGFVNEIKNIKIDTKRNEIRKKLADMCNISFDD